MTVLQADIPILKEGASFGGYRLVRELGRGGMAVVFEAEEVALRRSVALKVFHPRFESEHSALERFSREAEAASRLTHPAVVRVFARGLCEGVPYIATELIRGAQDLESLWRDWVARPETVPVDHVRLVATWFAELADALTEAHARGVLHRDLKPANFLLDGDGRVHLADFGLAWMNDQLAISRTGEMSGTPFYMCPEQVRSGSFSQDGACDIYSLGASLYQMLCLRRPVEGENAEQVFHSVLSQEPAAPHKVQPSLPRDLSQICMKAIEKDPRQRYVGMGEFAADLRRFLRHESVLARPPSWKVRVNRWMRRHPRWMASAVLVVASAVAWTAVDARLSGAESHVQAAETRWAEERLEKHGILMRAAQRSVRGFRYTDARQLFALTEPELQGWAWRHLQSSLVGHLATLKTPGGPRVLGMAVHPEGKFVAAGLGDGSVHLWRPLTGEGSHEIDRFAHGVYAIAFSPNGHWLAAAGDDGEVRLYDTESLKPVQSYFGHEFGVGWVCFTADSRSFVSVDDGGGVHCVEVATGKLVHDFAVAPRAIVAAASPQGSEFAVADGLGVVHRFSLATGAELTPLPNLHREPVFDLQYLNEQELVTGSLDGGVCGWSWASADSEPTRSWHWQADSPVQSVAWRPSTGSVLAGCKDGSVHVVKIGENHPPVRKTGWPAHFAFVNAIVSDPRGRYVATGGDDGAVQLWSAEAAAEVPTRQVSMALRSARLWGAEGFAVQCADGSWHYLSEWRAELLPGPVPPARVPELDGRAEAWHQADALTAIAGFRSGVTVMTSTGQVPLLELETDGARVLALRFVEDLDLLVGVRDDGVVQCWATRRTPVAQR